MKKTILTSIMICIISLSFAQQDNKEKYKDYTACTECLEKWTNSNGNTNTGSGILNRTNNGNHPVASQMSQEVKRNVSMVVGIFVAAVAAVIYVKTTQVATGIQ